MSNRRFFLDAMYFQMYVLKVILAWGLCISFFVGGDDRFGSKTLQGPRIVSSWIPLSPHLVWGIVFGLLALGLTLGFGHRWIVPVLYVGLIIYMFFSVSFWQSSDTFPAALVIAPYVIFALAHAILAVHLKKYGWKNQ